MAVLSVKTAYNYLMDLEQFNDPWPWKEIWKARAPFKVVLLTWLVVWKACLTHDKLQRKGFHLCSRCFLCHQEAEANGHLFLHCSITRQL
uniref:Putative ovule protein n=1 Tax=Solanum chacoense TaxID=4108 RepID=A0A0V0GPU6_SOLCH